MPSDIFLPNVCVGEFCATFRLSIYIFISRTIHDVKATDVGGRHVRFKAEVDFDGREIARFYLEQQDLEKMFQVSWFSH